MANWSGELMKPHGGQMRPADERSCLVWRPRPVRAIVMLLLLVGISIGANAASATAAPGPRAHVYLVRGLLNIFSLGLDEIASKLQQQGIATTIGNHTQWASLADDAAAQYKSGRVRTIVLIGHSSGATALPDMVARLDTQGVPVSLAIGLDSIFQTKLTGRVGRYMNLYVGDGAGTPVEKTKQFRGVLENINVAKVPGVGHLTIDKNQIIQQRIISAINAAVRRSPR